MEDFDEFEVVFGSNSNIAYEKIVSVDIKKRRHSLENVLFIDRLLQALGVHDGRSYISNKNRPLLIVVSHIVSKIYPAESHEKLRHLHEQIINSSSPDHHKHSALYYLLKDLHKHSHQSPRDFANASYLPGKYRIFIDGIWQLDRLEFDVIAQYLLDSDTAYDVPQRKL